MKNSMFKNEHGRSFLNDAIRGGRNTAGIKPSARIKEAGIVCCTPLSEDTASAKLTA